MGPGCGNRLAFALHHIWSMDDFQSTSGLSLWRESGDLCCSLTLPQHSHMTVLRLSWSCKTSALRARHPPSFHYAHIHTRSHTLHSNTHTHTELHIKRVGEWEEGRVGEEKIKPGSLYSGHSHGQNGPGSGGSLCMGHKRLPPQKYSEHAGIPAV